MGILNLLRSLTGHKAKSKPSESKKSKYIVRERLPIHAFESLGHEHFDIALKFWFANRQGRAPPDWSSFQPGKHPLLLPHVILYEKIEDRYAVRITGDVVSTYLTENYKGKFLDEITPPDKLEDIVMRLNRALSDGLPNYVEKVRLWKEDSSFFGYNALALPYNSKDKGLVRVLCILQFKALVEREDPA